MQRQSLLDGEDFSSIGGKGGGKSSGGGGGSSLDKGKMIKLLVALGLFVAAGGIFAAQMFGGGNEFKTEPVSAEKQREREEQSQKDQEELERLERTGEATVGGA